MKNYKSHLLVVESDFVTSNRIKGELEKQNYAVTVARSGNEAVALQKSGISFDLILLSMNLDGELSGPETAREILKINFLPIVFLTDDACAGTVHQTENIPCYGYVEKNPGNPLLKAGVLTALRLFEAEKVLMEEKKAINTTLDSIVDAVNDAIVYQDYDSGVVIDVNRKMLDMYCYGNKEEVIGFKPAMFSSGEDGYSDKDAQKYIKKAVQEGPQVFEWRAKAKNGRLFWVEVNLKIANIDGKRRICAVVRDIDIRKRTEEELMRNLDRLSIISELSSDYAYCHRLEADGSMRPVWHIGKFEHITGYSVDELYSSGGWSRLIHPDDLEKAAEYSRNKLAGTHDTVVVRIIRKDGELRWIQDGGCPWYGEDGSIIGTFGYAKDVTERMVTENELHKSVQRNQELLRELQHRAKNSFFLISSLISLLENESDDRATSKVLSEIKTRVTAISNMYELLYVTGSVEEVKLDEYLVKILSNLLLTQNIIFEHECDTVLVSVKKAIIIGLICSELVTNSLKYAFKKDRKNLFRLTLRNTGKKVSVILADNGPGLPPGLDAAAEASFGLKMIRILAQQIEAAVAFESNGGTRCTLTFPVNPAADRG
jgi:PAS domain S-box-containing protein